MSKPKITPCPVPGCSAKVRGNRQTCYVCSVRAALYRNRHGVAADDYTAARAWMEAAPTRRNAPTPREIREATGTAPLPVAVEKVGKGTPKRLSPLPEGYPVGGRPHHA